MVRGNRFDWWMVDLLEWLDTNHLPVYGLKVVIDAFDWWYPESALLTGVIYRPFVHTFSFFFRSFFFLILIDFTPYGPICVTCSFVYYRKYLEYLIHLRTIMGKELLIIKLVTNGCLFIFGAKARYLQKHI